MEYNLNKIEANKLFVVRYILKRCQIVKGNLQKSMRQSNISYDLS